MRNMKSEPLTGGSPNKKANKNKDKDKTQNELSVHLGIRTLNFCKSSRPKGRYQTPPGIQVHISGSAEARVQASLGFLGVMTGI